jgi:hypothetical protein
LPAVERATVSSQKYIDNVHNRLRVRTFDLIQIKNAVRKSQASAASHRRHFQAVDLIVEVLRAEFAVFFDQWLTPICCRRATLRPNQSKTPKGLETLWGRVG